VVDKIYIRDLLLRCIVGVNDDERNTTQDVLINVVMETDLQPAGTTDDFSRTVDYSAIKKEIIGLVEKSSYFLIEALAENIASCCLAHPPVKQVTVTVDKPGALRFAKGVAVEVTRGRT